MLTRLLEGNNLGTSKLPPQIKKSLDVFFFVRFEVGFSIALTGLSTKWWLVERTEGRMDRLTERP